MSLSIGIDIGGTNTKLGLVDNNGRVLEHRSFKTQGKRSFNAFFENLVKAINDLKNKSELEVKSIGIGVPNANWVTQLVEAPINLNWGTIPLSQKIHDHFRIPTILDKDANIAAIGEHYFGAAKNVNDFIVLTLGTGVGSGIFVNGQIVRSETGKAGEAGHIQVVMNKKRQCPCGGFGHLESYASSSGIELTAKEIIGEEITLYQLSDLLEENDEKAQKVLDCTAQKIGFAAAQLGSILAPKLIILSGGVSLLSPKLATLAEAYMNQLIFPSMKHECHIITTELDPHLGAIQGASRLLS